MRTRLAFVGLAAILVAATGPRAVAQDVKISGKVGLVKPGKLAKLVSKDATLVTLPTSGSGNDPTLHGATVQIFDTASTGGSFTHVLDKTGWKALGNPAGSKGYKYTGSHVTPIPDTVCTSVQVKPGKAKVKCKGSLGLTTPFAGLDGIIIGVPSGTATLRYCAAFGGTTKKNDATELKRKDAPAPGSCPVIAPTPTVTNTAVNTATRTATHTATVTNTPVNTATATNTAAATATRTSTNTAAATATSTGTRTNSPTPTNTPVVCPITMGRYTETTTGGTLKVSTGTPFAFPAGGTTIQDVSAPDGNCVSTTVIPYPGGLTVPIFCSLPSFAYTTQVVQHGCGIGVIDSNGGSDLTTTEKGDTSFTSGGCAAGQTCGGGGVLTCGGSGQVNVDSSGEINITVGDGTTDTCASGGTGNAMVSIPVDTTTWGASEAGCDGGTNGGNPCTVDADCPGGICGTACPDPNGFDGSDTLITQFPQTLDLTTDKATASFFDNDGNGCDCQGAGPQTLPAQTGQCINFGTMTVNVAGGGTIFSSAAPLHDLLFTTVQNSNISGPAAFGGATCGSPPVINFAGTAARCIIAP